MSQLAPRVVTCPRCGTTESMALFTSVDADTIQPQVDDIVAGTFEQKTCASCANVYQPEHPLLFASHARRVWIVMHPLADRRDYATLEPEVERVIAENFAAAAAIAAERLRGVRPRLVFGQHMLAEAVRASYAGLDAALFECAKLLSIRRKPPGADNARPVRAVLPERFADGGARRCAASARCPAASARASSRCRSTSWPRSRPRAPSCASASPTCGSARTCRRRAT